MSAASSAAASGSRQAPSFATHAAISSPAMPPKTVEFATPLPPSRFAPCTPPESSPATKSPAIAVVQSAANSTPPIM